MTLSLLEVRNLRFPVSHSNWEIFTAGAGGSAVANRLSENPNASVLLLEAGGS